MGKLFRRSERKTSRKEFNRLHFSGKESTSIPKFCGPGFEGIKFGVCQVRCIKSLGPTAFPESIQRSPSNYNKIAAGLPRKEIVEEVDEGEDRHAWKMLFSVRIKKRKMTHNILVPSRKQPSRNKRKSF
ncbi:hypothetical protein H5410_016803 [Solanum commersonii]|uniref:Uncharacterized protein n=1 Tax=Solanum commersonii TaxID=4109 RepID=A0A9J5ZY30_SOLCO|nr:hypothetical protein H5410_016803 [Solanum commersonii]